MSSCPARQTLGQCSCWRCSYAGAPVESALKFSAVLGTSSPGSVAHLTALCRASRCSHRAATTAADKRKPRPCWAYTKQPNLYPAHRLPALRDVHEHGLRDLALRCLRTRAHRCIQLSAHEAGRALMRRCNAMRRPSDSKGSGVAVLGAVLRQGLCRSTHLRRKAPTVHTRRACARRGERARQRAGEPCGDVHQAHRRLHGS